MIFSKIQTQFSHFYIYPKWIGTSSFSPRTIPPIDISNIIAIETTGPPFWHSPFYFYFSTIFLFHYHILGTWRIAGRFQTLAMCTVTVPVYILNNTYPAFS